MTKGSQDDVVLRLKAVLPPWFPSTTVFFEAKLQGIAASFSFVYSFFKKARLQTRISTQSGGFLDLTAWDFFGGRFTRRTGEPDTSWQPRILAEILRPRQTRAAIDQVLFDLTTKHPRIIELFNPGDVGGYDVYQMGGYDIGNTLYGDLIPNQFLLDAYRSPSQGIPIAGGYDTYNGAYDTGIDEYIDMAQVQGKITDAEIYQRIQQTVAAGVKAWTALHDNPPPALTTDAGNPLTSDTGAILTAS